MRSLLLAIAGVLVLANSTSSKGNILCYYDSRSYQRESLARMLLLDLEPALSFCSHLVYGYAGVQPDTYKMVSLNENLDINQGNYRAVTNFKSKYPHLKVLLSVGGDADTEDTEKYNLLLESAHARTAFVSSGVLLVKQHGFDGIDLAWQFPKVKPKKILSSFGSIWSSIKKTVGIVPVDEKASEHRDGFTALVREMKEALSEESNMQLTITVLPNVNASIYYDVPAIINLVDFVNIDAFDYYTAERNPKEADYVAPIYEPDNRTPQHNVEGALTYWVLSGAPPDKLILGITTRAHTWKLDSESEVAGVPPIHSDGPGDEGPHTKTEGILSYYEACALLISPFSPNDQKDVKTLKKIKDPSKRFGTYAFRLPVEVEETVDYEDTFDFFFLSNHKSRKTTSPGLWVGFEEPDTAAQKAAYVRAKNLGGVSIVDLSMDDFRGLCTGDKFPILRAAKFRL